MMRRVAMVLVCLLVGLGLYGGSYWWLFHTATGKRLVPPAGPDPFAAPAWEIRASRLYQPLRLLEHELGVERPYRKALLNKLIGEWQGETDGDFVRIEKNWTSRFRLGGFSGEGTVRSLADERVAYVEFRHDGRRWVLTLPDPEHYDGRGGVTVASRVWVSKLEEVETHPFFGAAKSWEIRRVNDRQKEDGG